MTSKSKINLKKQNNSYDEVIYETYPYSQTHPSHLYTIGKLFGITIVFLLLIIILILK